MKKLDIFTSEKVRMTILNTARRTGFFTPISFIRKQFGSFPFVVILKHPVRPSAVLSVIISVIVNAVNRSIFLAKLLYMGLIRTKHIISKIFKRFPLAFYSTTSVVRIRFMRWIIATLMYVYPNKIKSLFGQAVRGSGLAQLFISPATAGLGVSSFKVITPYNHDISTITSTLPHRSSSLGDMRKLKDFQPIKLATRYIKHFHTSSLAKVGKVVNENWGKGRADGREKAKNKNWLK